MVEAVALQPPPHPFSFCLPIPLQGNFAAMVEAVVQQTAVRVLPKLSPEETFVWIGEYGVCTRHGAPQAVPPVVMFHTF